MWRWLNSAPKRKPSEQDLPNPASFNDPSTIAEVNSQVLEAMKPNTQRKRSNYNEYSDDFRSKVARYAKENGVSAASKKFSKDLGSSLPEQTVRNWRNSMINMETTKKTTVDSIVTQKRGRPLLLGVDIDQKVKEYVRILREEGGIVNRSILLATARGFVLKFNRSLLPEFGGSLQLTRAWAKSFFERNGYVKRKGTKAARKLPDDFATAKENYLQKIVDLVSFHNIPPELVINWDQTATSIVPTSEWTLEERGSKQVDIIGLEDKRQITALFASTLSGRLLPPQLLYQGKTPQCHPNFKFPEDWDVHHSESHWSNEATMLRYIEKIIIPYCNATRQNGLHPLDQEALVIFDVYKAHRKDSIYQLLEDNNIKFVFVPACCTSELQPLDAEGSINASFKAALKEQFNLWYSGQLAKQLNSGKELKKIDLRLSVLKPLHASWFLKAFDKVSAQKSVIIAGWEKTGIKGVIEKSASGVVCVSI